jgi:uncharacterized membrane protein (DUF106 family)
MPGWIADENRETFNIVLIIIGIIIVIYFLIPHIINTKVLMSQVKECQKDIRELRKMLIKKIS